MGAVPFLGLTGFADATGTLGPGKEKRINRARERFQERFPQCKINVVIKTFRDDVPLEVALFWIFNSAGLSVAEDVGGKNHDILIVVDPKRMLAGLTMGYGLEPFFAMEDIDRQLARAVPQLQAGDITAGILTIMTGLSDLFALTCRRLPLAFGQPDEIPGPTLAVPQY